MGLARPESLATIHQVGQAGAMQQPSVPAHAQSVAQVLSALESDAAAGLSAHQARQRLERYGPNRLQEKPGVPIALRFVQQFNNPLLITLLVVGAVKAALGYPRDALVIISVTVINAVIGTVQESKAEQAIAALAQSVRTEVDVIRGGVLHRLSSEQLVPGDLVRLEAGAKVPADLRLINGRNLHTEEAALTGESLPLAQQHLRGEVVAVGIGQAEQAMHAHRTFLMQQRGALGVGAADRHQADGGAPPLALDLLAEQGLQAPGRVADRHIESVAGQSQAGNGGAIGFSPVGPVPTLRPPALLGLLHQLNGHRCTGGAAATTGAESQLGEALELGQAQVGVTLTRDLQGAIALAP